MSASSIRTNNLPQRSNVDIDESERRDDRFVVGGESYDAIEADAHRDLEERPHRLGTDEEHLLGFLQLDEEVVDEYGTREAYRAAVRGAGDDGTAAAAAPAACLSDAVRNDREDDEEQNDYLS